MFMLQNKKFLKKRKPMILVVIFFILIYFGVFTHIFESDFYSEFSYPMNSDITIFVREMRDGKQPSEAPINIYNFEYIYDCKMKCQNGPFRVVYIVKSAMNNFKNRQAIRNSWGFEKRFSDVPIRTVFLLGVDNINRLVQTRVDEESKKFGDIVQADFTDAYFNNTIKTIMGFKWAVNYCNNSKFYMFVDDDFYVSTRNVLQFLRNPVNYPAYLETPIDSVLPDSTNKVILNRDILSTTSEQLKLHTGVKLLQVLDFELPEKVKLFAGYVFVSSPHRHRTSKWYVPLSEYPFHLWPPYVSAGAYIVSNEALHDIYYGSFFTKHFRFDDIFLGLIAYKLDLEPLHSEEFYFYKKDYNINTYHYVVASHGYSDPNELLEVWNEQRSRGNA